MTNLQIATMNFFWKRSNTKLYDHNAGKNKIYFQLTCIKKYTSCGNKRYKTKTNLHEKKTAYVRKFLIAFMY